MAEYLDKEAFKKSVEERYYKPCKADGKDHNGCWCRACLVDDMLDEVECFQPADVAPVGHGLWAPVNKIDPISGYRCSKCRWIVGFDLTPYCPNCGAKMDGGDPDIERGATDAFDAFDDALQDTPTVDAEVVVRCKDCRKFKTYACRMVASGYDDFCSYGERTDGGHI